MRNKLKPPHVPTYEENLFITLIELTDDNNTFTEQELVDNIGVNARTLRYFQEDYNNFKFIGVIPEGVCTKINNDYRLIRPNSKLSRKYILKAKYNLICDAIQNMNTRKILGELQHDEQMAFNEIFDYDKLIVVAKEIEEELKWLNILSQ